MIDPTTSIRHAGLVRRYHTWPVLRQQTNAEHSWHVYCIYLYLYGDPPDYMTRAILFHDLGEIGPGDAPFPSKRDNPDLKKAHDRVEKQKRIELLGYDPEDDLEDEDRRRLKICDLLEMWQFGVDEWRMGNQLANLIVQRTREAALHLTLDETEFEKVEQFIRSYET